MADKKTKSKKELFNKLKYIVICISVIFVVNILNTFQVFDKTEFSSQDLRFRIRGVEETSDDIVIVAIDPQTLDMLGIISTPDRLYQVQLIENLYKAGAKAVLFDILFLGWSIRFPCFFEKLVHTILIFVVFHYMLHMLLYFFLNQTVFV